MAEIINLRTARKRHARAAGEAQAAANRAQHGRTKAERRTSEAEVARLDRTLEGARREREREQD
ncbi:DUF4169 family protein [Novosphingobium soli]|uniref:DUF4169 family protein n=1 Tax=Novosphingobium soli TaxID=574956 RepID=A0ABV6CXY8_9SPHN